jgi:hypothetical protein
VKKKRVERVEKVKKRKDERERVCEKGKRV